MAREYTSPRSRRYRIWDDGKTVEIQKSGGLLATWQKILIIGDNPSEYYDTAKSAEMRKLRGKSVGEAVDLYMEGVR